MNIRRAGGRPFNGLPPAAVLTAAGAPAGKAGARVGGETRVGERSAAIAARSVMGGRSIPRAAALGYMGEGRAWGKPRVRGSGRGGRGEVSGGAERSDSCAERNGGGEVSLGRRRWDICEREEHGESRSASEASAVQKQLFRA